MSSSGALGLEDAAVHVRFKLSALWVTVLLLFAYGDIIGFFAPGRIQDVMRGRVGGMEITQVFLFAISLYVAVASLMVFLSLVLAPRVCRWTNIVLSVLYIVSIVVSAVGESAYFVLLSIIEIALLLLVTRYAWAWPQRRGT